MEISFCKTILNNIVNAINRFPNRSAFCINEEHYNYMQFGQCASKIRRELKKTDYRNTKVGLVINDDLETYASIIALWLEGDCYVPLHPNWPLERCQDIVSQVGLRHILDSSPASRYEEVSVIETGELAPGDALPEYRPDIPDSALAYILFTSGSTGQPKGVVNAHLTAVSRTLEAYGDPLPTYFKRN